MTNQETKQERYEKYAILEAQIKELTEQKEELRKEIMEDVLKTPELTVSTPFGKFTITQLKTWKYTPAVNQLEEMFKATKATEQSTGVATYTEKPSLRFIQFKL